MIMITQQNIKLHTKHDKAGRSPNKVILYHVTENFAIIALILSLKSGAVHKNLTVQPWHILVRFTD